MANQVGCRIKAAAGSLIEFDAQASVAADAHSKHPVLL
jgi:tyrosine-protein phosphatase YwqE